MSDHRTIPADEAARFAAHATRAHACLRAAADLRAQADAIAAEASREDAAAVAVLAAHGLDARRRAVVTTAGGAYAVGTVLDANGAPLPAGHVDLTDLGPGAAENILAAMARGQREADALAVAPG